MLERRNLLWVIVAAIPLGVLLKMWLVTGGLPYNTDSNESFSAYVQGQSMIHFNPWANAFLPDDATGYHTSAHPFTYTHGPNLPRYFSALMYLLGVHSLEWQILVSAIVSVLLSLWFIAQSFPEPLEKDATIFGITLGLVIGVLFAVDFIGVLQFLGNLWRTWHFPLFWGCIWSVRTRPRLAVGFILFFLLFQLEFLFAIFTATTALLYLLWTHRSAWRRLLSGSYVAMAAGAIASLIMFAGQLIVFYGWQGFWFDLRAGVVIAAPVFAVWLGVSLSQYSKHPDFIHSVATALTSTYKGHSFVSASTFPHMIAHYTGRWAYYSKAVFPGTERLDQTYNWNADRNRNLDYETPEYYLCETLPYSVDLNCEDIALKMSALGHTLVERGPGYFIMRLNWHLPSRSVLKPQSIGAEEVPVH